MRKPLLLSAAVFFFGYIQLSGYLWLRAHGSFPAGFTHAWETLRRDPMVLMAWNDMAVFTAIVLVWFWRDLTRVGRSKLWWWATLIGGCPPLLVYLALHGSEASPTAGERVDASETRR